MTKEIAVGLLGLGTVGEEIVEIILNHQEDLQYRLDKSIHIKKILIRDLYKTRSSNVDPSLLTNDYVDVVHHPDIDIIIEVMNGVYPAYDYISQALETQKQVITANTDLVSLHGVELESLAKKNRCDFFYEASVGGGIPLLSGLSSGFSSDRIWQIMGVANGATNYILTNMAKKEISYKTALEEAKHAKITGGKPISEVDGTNSAKKIAILTRLSFFTDIKLEEIEVTGITDISTIDLMYAEQLGYKMKLIGITSCKEGYIEASVQPMFLEETHPLANIKNSYNGIYVKSESAGETMFYGRGAGGLPSATAIVSDVVKAAKNILLGIKGKSTLRQLNEKETMPSDENFSNFYMRIHVQDVTGSFVIISDLFNQARISFKRILQNPTSSIGISEIVIVTHDTSLANVTRVQAKLNQLGIIDSIDGCFRVEEHTKS